MSKNVVIAVDANEQSTGRGRAGQAAGGRHGRASRVVTVMVVGSTSRGPLGRLVIGAVGERLLSGSARPVAIAPRGYAEQPAAPLERIGMAHDASDESRHAPQAARMLGRSSGAQLRVITVFERMSSETVTPGLASGGISVNQIIRSALRTGLDDVLAEQPEELATEGRFLEG